MINRPEIPEIPSPSHLDIIKVDGIWGQVIAMSDNEYSVKSLSDNTIFHVNPENLILTNKHRLFIKVSDLIQDPSSGFTQQMFDNVQWGPEQIQDPEKWKGEVNVFGEYETMQYN